MEERRDKGTDQKEKRKWDVEIGGKVASGGNLEYKHELLNLQLSLSRNGRPPF